MNNQYIFWNSAGQIIPHRLYEYFSNNGIFKYFPDGSNKKNSESVIITVHGKIVSLANVEFLLEMTRNHIIACTEEGINRGKILDSLHTKTALFGDKNIKLLKTLEPSFISDKPGIGYFFFRNGVVEVTGDDIQLKEYSEYEDYVWEQNIVPFDYKQIQDPLMLEKSDFKTFINDLAIVTDEAKTVSRQTALQSGIGYLLHRYKDPATVKAIIVMDTYVNGLPNGGSGKTLLMNAIGKLRNLAIIDGKFYDQREWFAFSSVDLSSEVLLFDDVDFKFEFEKIFPLVSTGMLVRQKYKNHFYVPFAKSPKLALTTNYAVSGESSSHRRRKFEFEVTPTYSADFSPREKFGHNFFDDWEEEDWNKFYNTMIRCLQVFLKNGLVESEPINLHLTKLISRTCDEFVEWAGDVIQSETQYNKRLLYDSFIKTFPEYKQRLRQREFTSWLRSFGDFKNYLISENHSGDIRSITYKTKEPEVDK